uniref:hypothetical protein n=1 Tax=Okeania sp. SIO2F4 TaxID=2607790 RepID=UPI0025CDBE4B|nr:hypothetical protein [Okeania sp. SIO2F4]
MRQKAASRQIILGSYIAISIIFIEMSFFYSISILILYYFGIAELKYESRFIGSRQHLTGSKEQLILTSSSNNTKYKIIKSYPESATPFLTSFFFPLPSSFFLN